MFTESRSLDFLEVWYFALGSAFLTPEILFMTLNQGRIRGFFIRGEDNL